MSGEDSVIAVDEYSEFIGDGIKYVKFPDSLWAYVHATHGCICNHTNVLELALDGFWRSSDSLTVIVRFPS